MDRQRILEKLPVLAGLSQDEIGAISQLCQDRKYQANEVVFTESSRGEEIYILKKGKVRIDFRVGGEKDSATVHRLTQGHVFGELALVDNRRRSATATCESDCEVIAISREGLYDLFETDSHIGYMLMKNLAMVLANRLRKTNLQLVATILWE